MKLVTKAIEKKFEKFPYGSQDGKGKDAEVILKVFNPYGAGTWLIIEAWKEGDDWMGFGWANLFGTWELGTISITELQNTTVSLRGVPIGGLERDLYCEGQTVGELMAA